MYIKRVTIVTIDVYKTCDVAHWSLIHCLYKIRLRKTLILKHENIVSLQWTLICAINPLRPIMNLCGHVAPSHYLNWCWFSISGVLCLSSGCILAERTQAIIIFSESQNWTFWNDCHIQDQWDEKALLTSLEGEILLYICLYHYVERGVIIFTIQCLIKLLQRISGHQHIYATNKLQAFHYFKVGFIRTASDKFNNLDVSYGTI